MVNNHFSKALHCSNKHESKRTHQKTFRTDKTSSLQGRPSRQRRSQAYGGFIRFHQGRSVKAARVDRGNRTMSARQTASPPRPVSEWDHYRRPLLRLTLAMSRALRREHPEHLSALTARLKAIVTRTMALVCSLRHKSPERCVAQSRWLLLECRRSEG